jgi:hypothetical protein
MKNARDPAAHRHDLPAFQPCTPLPGDHQCARRASWLYQSWWSLLNHFTREDKHKALEKLGRVGIQDKAYIRADQLSGGSSCASGSPGPDAEPELMLADERSPALTGDLAIGDEYLEY